MRLVALLCWYEEPVAWLAELVASLGRAGCDHIVAVDGSYFLYPKGRARSETDQADVINRTAAGCGMATTIHAPSTPWIGNEIEKRSFLFALGHAVTDPDDWFWVCDGDEVITDAFHAPDGERPMSLKQALAETGVDVGEVLLHAKDDPQQDDEYFPIRKLFRRQPDPIRVVGNHFTYVAPDGELLWTMRDQPQAEALYLPGVRVWHRVNQRPPSRVLRRAAYYRRRDEVGAETI